MIGVLARRRRAVGRCGRIGIAHCLSLNQDGRGFFWQSQRTSYEHRAGRLAQDAIDVRTEQSLNSKARSVRADTDKIDLISLRVVENLSIRLPFAYYVLNRAPEMSLIRNSLLQAACGFVIHAFLA